MKQKRIFMIIILAIGMLLMPNRNYAVLQANSNTHGTKKDNAINWMLNIRKMETKDQAMGLEETINETTMKSTSGSNSLDVHMIKTTEYGAIAILSASGYGNSKKIQESDIKTTTGNKSGIYFNQVYERTAGGLSGRIFTGVDGKYYDAYGTDYTSAKVGDGLGKAGTTIPGCAGWHDATRIDWVTSSYPYFQHGINSVFSFNDCDTDAILCRSVVVCGAGF